MAVHHQIITVKVCLYLPIRWEKPTYAKFRIITIYRVVFIWSWPLTVLLFCYFQDVLRDQGCLPRLSKLLELQRMAMWLRHTGASTSVSITINAVTNLATNEKNNKDMEVSTCVLLFSA